MSKELTPLEIVKRWKAQIHWNKDWGWEKELSIIEKALKETDKLRQINCELLEQKNALKEDIHKCREALNIIRKNGIDILEFMATKKAKTYNENTKRTYVKDYTDEEYHLLKEVFNDKNYLCSAYGLCPDAPFECDKCPKNDHNLGRF